jgi:ProP effector
MSNASLKEQLEAIVSNNTDKQESRKAETKATKPTLSVPKAKNLPSRAHVSAPKHQAKPKWLEHALYGVELLKAYFPNCFMTGGAVKPLKKGIKQDLVKFLSTLDTIVTEDKACMVKSLTYYVNTISYHKGVVEGASRIDLLGNVAGVVTADEATYSVDRQKAKRQAKLLASPSHVQSHTQEVITE